MKLTLFTLLTTTANVPRKSVTGASKVFSSFLAVPTPFK